MRLQTWHNVDEQIIKKIYFWRNRRTFWISQQFLTSHFAKLYFNPHSWINIERYMPSWHNSSKQSPVQTTKFLVNYIFKQNLWRKSHNIKQYPNGIDKWKKPDISCGKAPKKLLLHGNFSLNGLTKKREQTVMNIAFEFNCIQYFWGEDQDLQKKNTFKSI